MIGCIFGYKAIAEENPEWIQKIIMCEPHHNRLNYKPLIALQQTQKLI
jgi:hypothetical protein